MSQIVLYDLYFIVIYLVFGWCIGFMEMRGIRYMKINTDFWNYVNINEYASKCHGEFVFPNWHYWRRNLQNVALFLSFFHNYAFTEME